MTKAKLKKIFEGPRLDALGQRFTKELGRELTFAERAMLIDTFYEGVKCGINALALANSRKAVDKVSGRGEAVSRVYRLVKGESRHVWLYPANEKNPADHIYMTNNPENTTSNEQLFQGFGGATLPMPLENGKTYMLHGGWHSNSEALFKDTGVDLREKHLTHWCDCPECGKIHCAYGCDCDSKEKQ